MAEVSTEDFEISSAGVRLHARKWVPEDVTAQGRIPLVLLHGFMQDARAWEATAPVLAADRPVIALDFAGFGESERPDRDAPYRLESMAASVADLIDEATPEGKACVLGYSMGGRVALSLAKSRPDRVAALMLEAAGLGIEDPEERACANARDAKWVEQLESGTMEEFVSYWESLPLFASQADMPEERQEAMRAMRRECSPAVLARVLRGAGQHTMPYFGEAVCGFPMPIYYLAGQLDQKYTKVALRLSSTAGATVTLLSCGHNAHTEQPEAFCEHARSYLSTLDEAR